MMQAAGPMQVEKVLDDLILRLTKSDSTAAVRAALIEARRLRNVTMRWGAIPPPPDARREMLTRVMELVAKAGPDVVASKPPAAPAAPPSDPETSFRSSPASTQPRSVPSPAKRGSDELPALDEVSPPNRPNRANTTDRQSPQPNPFKKASSPSIARRDWGSGPRGATPAAVSAPPASLKPTSPPPPVGDQGTDELLSAAERMRLRKTATRPFGGGADSNEAEFSLTTSPPPPDRDVRAASAPPNTRQPPMHRAQTIAGIPEANEAAVAAAKAKVAAAARLSSSALEDETSFASKRPSMARMPAGTEPEKLHSSPTAIPPPPAQADALITRPPPMVKRSSPSVRPSPPSVRPSPITAKHVPVRRDAAPASDPPPSRPPASTAKTNAPPPLRRQTGNYNLGLGSFAAAEALFSQTQPGVDPIEQALDKASSKSVPPPTSDAPRSIIPRVPVGTAPSGPPITAVGTHRQGGLDGLSSAVSMPGMNAQRASQKPSGSTGSTHSGTAPPASARPSVPPADKPLRTLVSPGITIVRPDASLWQPHPVAPGVTIKLLYRDPRSGVYTALVRLAPGATLPRRRHVAAEEAMLVSGIASVGAHEMRAGEYCRAESDTVHDAITTTTGCTFFLCGSEHDEFLDET